MKKLELAAADPILGVIIYTLGALKIVPTKIPYFGTAVFTKARSSDLAKLRNFIKAAEELGWEIEGKPNKTKYMSASGEVCYHIVMHLANENEESLKMKDPYTMLEYTTATQTLLLGKTT